MTVPRAPEGQPYAAGGPGSQRLGGCLCLQARRRKAALGRKVSDGVAKADCLQRSVPARTLGDIEKAFGKAPVSLKAPCKGILRPLKGAAPPAARGRGLRRAVGVPQRHPVVLATAGKALASLRGARVPPNRLPLVRRGRPAALTLRRGAGNKGSCVCPSRSLAHRPDTHSCNGQGFPGCRRWDARGDVLATVGGLLWVGLGFWGFFAGFLLDFFSLFSFISSLWVSY